MAKKTLRVFLEKEVDTIIDKTIGRTQTTVYVDSGALWITLARLGNKENGGTTATVTVSTSLSLKELRTILREIDPKEKAE